MKTFETMKAINSTTRSIRTLGAALLCAVAQGAWVNSVTTSNACT